GGGGGRGAAESAGAPGLEREQPRGFLGGREGEPDVAVAAAAGGAGGAGDGEAADGGHRQRRGDGKGGFCARRDCEQGDQRAGGSVGVWRLHRAGLARRGGDDQRVPVGAGGGLPVAQGAAV